MGKGCRVGRGHRAPAFPAHPAHQRCCNDSAAARTRRRRRLLLHARARRSRKLSRATLGPKAALESRSACKTAVARCNHLLPHGIVQYPRRLAGWLVPGAVLGVHGGVAGVPGRGQTPLVLLAAHGAPRSDCGVRVPQHPRPVCGRSASRRCRCRRLSSRVVPRHGRRAA